MSIYIVLGVILSGWAMLSALGAERQRELVRVRRYAKMYPPVAKEEIAPVAPAPPPSARPTAKPAVNPPAANSKAAGAKPPANNPAPAKTLTKAPAKSTTPPPAAGKK